MALQETKKGKCLLFTLAIFIAGVVLFVGLSAQAPDLPDGFSFKTAPAEQVEVPVEVDAKLFYSAVDAYPTGAAEVTRVESEGGIVPHHAIASPLIAEFFAELAKSDPDIRTFVILGPNHRNAGLAPVISCRANWRTSFGDVATDYDFLEPLERSHLFAFDEENCTSDQAIQTLVPFVRYYFPRAKIAPLLFSSEESKEKSLLLAQEIDRTKSSDIFLLASLDFSHYLSLGEAEKKDAFTAASIEKKDYSSISRMDSDYVDSPSALIAFLRAMEISGANQCEILQHKNSADFPGQGSINTTSYFSMIYGR